MKKTDITFKEWIIDLFRDEEDHASVKPFVAIVGAFFLCGSLVASAVSNYAPLDSLVDSVMIITAIGMGSDTVDKFTRKNNFRKFDTYQNINNDEYERRDNPPIID